MMTYDRDQLERLISREIDGESTAADREQLELLIQHEPGIEQLLEDYRRLDREVGDALRVVVGAEPLPMPRRDRRAIWRRVNTVLAAAAGVALLVWVRSPTPPTPVEPSDTRNLAPRQQASVSADWFVPQQLGRDVVEPVSPLLERPGLQVQGVDREWILVPAEERGTFYVIEVDRTQDHVIQIHQDF
jgi:hypothetical protein